MGGLGSACRRHYLTAGFDAEGARPTQLSPASAMQHAQQLLASENELDTASKCVQAEQEAY